MIFDAHTHTLCPGVNALVAGRPELSTIPYARDMTAESAAVDRAQFPDLARRFNDLPTRLADMARIGVDHQLVLPAPGQQHYWPNLTCWPSYPACRTNTWPRWWHRLTAASPGSALCR